MQEATIVDKTKLAAYPALRLCLAAELQGVAMQTSTDHLPLLASSNRCRCASACPRRSSLGSPGIRVSLPLVLVERRPCLSSTLIGRSFEPPIGGLPKMCLNLFSTICWPPSPHRIVPPTVGMIMSCSRSSARSILSQVSKGSPSSFRLSGTPAALWYSHLGHHRGQQSGVEQRRQP